MSNKDKEALEKPWLTNGILTSILTGGLNEVKSNTEIPWYYKLADRSKDPRRRELFDLLKTYINSIDKMTKLSKANLYHRYFEENKGNLNKIW